MARKRKRGPSPRSAEQRFWPKVERTDDCWYWTGKDWKFRVNKDERTTPARMAWKLCAMGEIPEGIPLLRICDTPNCVRPAHHRLASNVNKAFWLHVKKTRGKGCWPWTGTTHTRTGVPRMLMDGTWVLAPNYVWEQRYGEVPSGMKIRSTCGNPLCVRPDHLAALPVKKVSGEAHHWAKLTQVQRREILRFLSWGTFTQGHIAKMFGINENTVTRLKQQAEKLQKEQENT